MNVVSVCVCVRGLSFPRRGRDDGGLILLLEGGYGVRTSISSDLATKKRERDTERRASLWRVVVVDGRDLALEIRHEQRSAAR